MLKYIFILFFFSILPLEYAVSQDTQQTDRPKQANRSTGVDQKGDSNEVSVTKDVESQKNKKSDTLRYKRNQYSHHKQPPHKEHQPSEVSSSKDSLALYKRRIFNTNRIQLPDSILNIPFKRDGRSTPPDSIKRPEKDALNENIPQKSGIKPERPDSVLSSQKPEEETLPDPDEDIHFTIKVIDSTTKAPLPASVRLLLYSKSGHRSLSKANCREDGTFGLKLTRDSKFELNIIHEDYEPIYDTINLMEIEAEDGEIHKVYKMYKFQVGDIIHLEEIHFKQGDHHLQRSAHPTLDKLINLMKENPGMHIKLKGHTDNSGTHDMLIKLSQRRVYEVRGYMVRRGIPARRIKAEGYGYSQPINKGTDPESQAENRRVEFEILKL